MKLGIRHIITLIIASLISFEANADMSHIASCFSDGHIVDYRYDAGGKRLGAYYLLASDDVFNDGIGVEGGGVSIQELVREWSGEFVYENGELERILTDNGYWKNGRYWFYIKDWQGNNRVTVGGISDATNASSGGMSLNPTATLIQAKDINVYYPYGTRFSDVFATTTDRYQYSGKEFDRMNGLDLYDFHARQYDPVLGRFTTPDPLSEKYYHLSPYAYCASNPLRYIDPTGNKIIFINGKIGFGSPNAGASYWNGKNSSFVNGAIHFFNDNNTYFVDTDYEWLSSAEARIEQGYDWAQSNFNELTNDINSDESFKLVSHSMGGAFSKGVEKYLKEQGFEVSHNLMINTYQVDDIPNNQTSTIDIDYQLTDDPVLNLLDFNFGNKSVENSDFKIREKSTSDILYKHREPIVVGKHFWDKLEKIINKTNE